MEDKDKKNEINKNNTKICKCCGKRLPLSSFSIKAKGRRSVCEHCIDMAKKGTQLNKYTIQELLRELRNRGVKGKFTYTKVETIEI